MAVLLTAAGIIGLTLFAHEVNTSIAMSQINARSFSERAIQQHQQFFAAAYEFENRDVHEGLHTVASIPRAPRGRNGQVTRTPGAAIGPADTLESVRPPPVETAVVDGVV